MTTRQAQLLLLPEDEVAIAAAILARYPDVRFIDHVAWDSPSTPPVRESVVACHFGASIWSPRIYPELPVDIRSNGTIMGPQIGPVVQWLRSREVSPGVLASGRWAASFTDSSAAAMVEFVGDIWKILFRETFNSLQWAGATLGRHSLERRFRVGKLAYKDAEEGVLMLKGGQMILRPERRR
ncbi:hypothetical protein KDL01_39995 [Actinospica durhamensis]|uniref:Uncharacterized protein n=1 Tax=Actinospica durhamensis TaxID=1508375 RepID=A0A941EYB2_9ACTN|nr:hypothetical protein [Actinospica durhamensis]MBR7839506.1 hypothetical protein [Actinospica durhamensis]